MTAGKRLGGKAMRTLETAFNNALENGDLTEDLLAQSIDKLLSRQGFNPERVDYYLERQPVPWSPVARRLYEAVLLHNLATTSYALTAAQERGAHSVLVRPYNGELRSLRIPSALDQLGEFTRRALQKPNTRTLLLLRNAALLVGRCVFCTRQFCVYNTGRPDQRSVPTQIAMYFAHNSLRTTTKPGEDAEEANPIHRWIWCVCGQCPTACATCSAPLSTEYNRDTIETMRRLKECVSCAVNHIGYLRPPILNREDLRRVHRRKLVD